jgi:hypothetical protein
MVRVVVVVAAMVTEVHCQLLLRRLTGLNISSRDRSFSHTVDTYTWNAGQKTWLGCDIRSKTTTGLMTKHIFIGRELGSAFGSEFHAENQSHRVSRDK